MSMIGRLLSEGIYVTFLSCLRCCCCWLVGGQYDEKYIHIISRRSFEISAPLYNSKGICLGSPCEKIMVIIFTDCQQDGCVSFFVQGGLEIYIRGSLMRDDFVSYFSHDHLFIFSLLILI